MKFMRVAHARIRGFLSSMSGGHRADSELREELLTHIDMQAAEFRRRGMSAELAHREAMRVAGGVTAAVESVHERRGLPVLENVVTDVRYALRALRAKPAFTIAVLLTLALGIGANGAMFSVVEAVLIRPLPYRDAGQLVHIWETQRNDPAHRTEASYPDFLDWRAERDIFVQLEGYDETNVTVGANATAAQRVGGARVSPGFLGLLGVQPMLGRTFTVDDDVLELSSTVILSHQYWQRQHNADSSIVGRNILIDGRPVVVIGVLPQNFRFAPSGDAQLWFTLGRSASTRAERFNHWVRVIGRLRDGVSIDAGRARMNAVMQRLGSQYAETNAGRGAVVIPLREEIVGDVQPLLTALFGAVIIVLIIATANVASLLLARSIERGPEMAVRTALGASRIRLVQQLVTESLVLALAGGALGIVVATIGVRLLLAAFSPQMFEHMPHLHDVRVNGVMIAYTLLATGMVGIGIGLVPALQASRGRQASLIRSGSRGAGTGRGRQRLRDALVAIEIACSLVLVVGASLMARSIVHLLQVDPGFVAENVVVGRIALAGPAYQDSRKQQNFFEDLLTRVRALPNVKSVGGVTNAPLQGGGTNTFRVEGEPEPPASNRPEATMRGVAGDYFETMGIRLVDGRLLNNRDDSAAAPAVLINASLARQLAKNRSAVGARLRFYAFPESAWAIVGVVADVKTGSLDAPIPPTVYYSHLQAAENRMSIFIRSTENPKAVMLRLPDIVKAMDPAVPLYQVSTMEQQIDASPAVLNRRYPFLLIGVFAIASLALSIVGLYGVIAYTVAQRTPELAVRIALGAKHGDIQRLVLGRGVRLAVIGVGVGIVGALVLTRFLEQLLFGVGAMDFATFAVVAGIIGVVALIASWFPARRAAAVDPALVLRAQ